MKKELNKAIKKGESWRKGYQQGWEEIRKEIEKLNCGTLGGSIIIARRDWERLK